MLTQEEDVEAKALHRRGWSIAAIARHLGRDRKTIRAYVRGEREPGVRRPAGPDPLGPFLPYIAARMTDDPHLWASALYDEVVALGYPRSYVSFARQLRTRALRPACAGCAGAGARVTIEIEHPPGEEIQWDWLEWPDPPWGGAEAHCLVGTLAHSAKFRAVLCEAEDQPHLVAGIDHILRALGGTARRWRFDRMASVCDPATGLITASFAAVARYYGVGVDICPARRAKRKGAVESRNHYLTQRFWRSLQASSAEQAQAKLERFLSGIADARPHKAGGSVAGAARAERLAALPAAPYPATITVERRVGDSALVAYAGNRYSLAPGLEGRQVSVRRRLGAGELEIVSPAGAVLARHRLAPAGARALVRTDAHRAALEEAVLAAFATAQPCRRKANRPPGPAAIAAAKALRAGHTPGQQVSVDLAAYAALAEGAR